MARGRGRRAGSPLTDERNTFEEALRILRSNLSVALLDLERPTVIFTSPNPNEGKTVTCANLAMSFAASGKRVVLVDLDLRHPNAHKLIGAHNEFGVSDVLLGRRTLEESIQYIGLPTPRGQSEWGLYFLATGHPVANPTELLGSGRTHQLLEGLARQADLVLLDTPPILPVADTLVIGRMAAGAVLVTESRNTAIDAVNKAKDLLTRNQTRLLGVVLNKFQARDARGTFNYGYGYGYGATPEDVVYAADGNGASAAPPLFGDTPTEVGPTPSES
ncbi:MAG TPA: CpsD/CapB family tyrosine-protein kinase [Acidimicrobiales bacterium]|nr:CpsD/CapB family tyrosine-protein kinase [Acidimicrobiales bacterium]